MAHLRSLRKRYAWLWRNGYPFLVSRRPTPVERLRAWGLAVEQAQRPPVKRKVATVAMTVGWSIASVWNAAEAAWLERHDADFRPWQRFISYLYPALRHNALIPALRRLRNESGQEPAIIAPHLLYDRETRIWRALNAARGADGEEVQDKAQFHAIMRRYDLPVVPVFAATEADRKAAVGQDLFVKPARGNRGIGVQAYRWIEGTGWRHGEHTYSSFDALLADVEARDSIIQPLLCDGAAFREAGSNGLSTVRIVTLHLPDGTLRVAAAQLQLAKGLISQEGAVFELDPVDGRLITWWDAESLKVRQRAHAGAAIPFVAVPEWDGFINLAKHAHRIAFPRFASLGWDIVMTDAGLLLLEANQGWGMMTHQVLGKALGLGPIAGAAEAWLVWLAHQRSGSKRFLWTRI